MDSSSKFLESIKVAFVPLSVQQKLTEDEQQDLNEEEEGLEQ